MATVVLLFGTAAHADLQSGLQAFENGDYETAYQELRPAAEHHGYPRAMNNLGTMFENGWGVERDGERAAHWYQQAALKRYRKAMYNLGILHAEGHVVPRDLVKGAAWLGTAYDHGEEDARGPLKLSLDGMTAEQVEEARALRKRISTLLYELPPEPPKAALTEPPVDRSRLMGKEQIIEFFSGNQVSYEFRKSTALETAYPHKNLEKALAGKRARLEGEYRDGYYRASWWLEGDMMCIDYAKIDEFDDCFWVERLTDSDVRTYSRKTGAATVNHIYRRNVVTQPSANPEPVREPIGNSREDTTAARR